MLITENSFSNNKPAAAFSFITWPQIQQKLVGVCTHWWNTLYWWKKEAGWFFFFSCLPFFLGEWLDDVNVLLHLHVWISHSISQKQKPWVRVGKSNQWCFSVLPFMSVSHPAQTHWGIVKTCISVFSSACQDFCSLSCLSWRHHPGNPSSSYRD